jgi:Spy/CpxP family protein refolding chaperone
MKKVIKIGLAVVFVIALVSVAMAVGPGMGMGMGHGMMGYNMSPEQSQRFADFQKETLPLRQKMLQLKTELMTLRAQTNPDWKAISEKQKEMVDVKTEIQKKAREAGIADLGPGRCRSGKGMGMMGMGRMGM